MSEPLIPISPKQALIFACFLVLYEFLTYVANDMILPGMISVVQSFHASESNIATSMTLYILGGASLQLILGPLSDSYGRKPLMLIGACLFFIFTLLIACSHSMNQFLIARFFQGMGLCFIGVIGYATIQELFEEMDAIRLIAIMANVAILAPLLGPIFGAVVIHYTSWRLIFVVIAAFAVVAFWGLYRFMPETIGARKKDGQIILATSFSATTIISNYKKLLTHVTFCSGTLSMGLIGIPCLAWIALAPVIMIAEAQLTVIEYALWQLPVFGATIIGNWVLRRLTYHYEIKQIILLGCIIFAIGIVLMALLPYLYGNNYLLLLPGVIIYFFSLSIVNAPLNRFCLFITSLSKGTVTALISLTVMSISAVGIEIANLFYSDHSNLNFAIFCNAVGLLFLLFIRFTFLFSTEVVTKCQNDEQRENL